MADVAPLSELLTIRESAQYLRVGERTLWKYINEGRLPAYRVGPTLVRLARSDLERMVTASPR